MRIKNFIRFVNENINPEWKEDTTETGDSRYGQPEVEPDYGDFEDWQPTGDKAIKQKSDINNETGEDFDYEDYYPQEEEGDSVQPEDPDYEPFISDTDVESDESEIDDPDYFY